MCLFVPAPYCKLNKGFFLGFLLKPLGGLLPPRGLNKKASEKNPLSITYSTIKSNNFQNNTPIFSMVKELAGPKNHTYKISMLYLSYFLAKFKYKG